MTFAQARAALDQLDNVGESEDYHARDDYSGRGSFGKSTPALVGPCALTIGWALAKAGVPIEDLPQRSDSMGSDVVVY